MTHAPPLTLTTPLSAVPSVGPSRAAKLRKLKLRIARDVLFLFPRDFEHPPASAGVDELVDGQSVTLTGTITDAELVSRNPGRSIFGAILENDSGAVRLVFFNQPFRADQLPIGRRIRVRGVAKLNGLRFELTHPNVVTLTDDEEDDVEPPILPVYPLTEGVKQFELRQLATALVPVLASELAEVLPEPLRQRAAQRLADAGPVTPPNDEPVALPPIAEAIRQLHQPRSDAEVAAARSRFVFQELLVMQLALAMRRRNLTTALRAPPIQCTPKIRNRIWRRFPFDLTDDQTRVMATIAEDMRRQFPMNRLLQGDVGSGKTVVAFFAMLLTVASRYQATMMAPTEVLARQHHRTLTSYLSDARVRVGLLCGSLSSSERRETLAACASGELDILIGTQALLYDVRFGKLGLCVIDEQHKFGVDQRVALRSGGVDPHYLVMSATPIPRSVAMTQFGDVELSTLRSKPAGRGEVHTYLAHHGWRDRWWQFVRQRIGEGRQAFVVAPQVGDQPELDDGNVDDTVTSVTSIFQELSNGPLSGLNVALLHGRMETETKERVMNAFAEGEIDVLVCTSVIEVGIDVPNATVMAILGANRFGLAQLHQLRGRVGRGTHAGHVAVFVDGSHSPEEDERLKVFASTTDGFELAEEDFRIRGPGDVLGRRQTGLAPLRIADLSRDTHVLQVARDIAQDLIDENPDLHGAQWEGLRMQVLRRYEKTLDLGDIA